ncbi:MAG: hypothetical protein IJZ91_01760 [Oscillospiraceae bacterium]|nr:hypothetical protein [Oscillospiraceae bacterium]
MKKLILMICAVAMLLSLCACGAKGFDKKNMQLSEYDGVAVNELVQMFIKQKTVTDATEELSLFIENLTDKDYSFDAAARLEVNLDGSWYLIAPKSDAMTMQLYHLPANGSEETGFNLAGNYDKLPEGSYRIVKLFVDTDGSQALAAAEFNIGRG